MEREQLGSRLGFILISAGCAIGIGNVWKFPYLVGENGGGAFVLLYLVFLVLMGVPVLTMEFAIGRAARKSPVRMYQELEKPGTKWHIHGPFCLAGNVLLMMYYTTVAGWMLLYFFKMATGTFAGMDVDAVSVEFTGMQGSPTQMLVAMAIIVAVGFAICSVGLQNGVERITKVMMTLLLLIMVVLAVNSLFLDGAGEGLAFYLKPVFEKMKQLGVKSVVGDAMSQAFFTLSIGIGSMAIFGSYINRERSLAGEAVNVVLLDTFVAICSGLIIIPACFAYGVEPSSGPSLLFITLPNIFNHMPLGRLWGSLFFVFMTFAAFSTVIGVFENIMASVMDLTGWTRKKTGLICGICIFLLSLPCLLGLNVWSFIQPLGEGSDIMTLEDMIVSNLLLPIGCLVFVLFSVLKSGWGWEEFLKEANTGKGLRIHPSLKWYMTIFLPLAILVVMVMGIMALF